jgi:hypothetical protein
VTQCFICGPRHRNVRGPRNGSTAVSLDIENIFDTTWCLGLLYKSSDLKFELKSV